MREVEARPRFVGGRLVRFLVVLLCWSVLVSLGTIWWTLNALGGSGCETHTTTCVAFAADRTNAAVNGSVSVWIGGAAVFAAVNWALPARRPRHPGAAPR
ncbi:MAG: hypothetical protein AB1673_00570 [Actinomycetota bacterium]